MQMRRPKEVRERETSRAVRQQAKEAVNAKIHRPPSAKRAAQRGRRGKSAWIDVTNKRCVPRPDPFRCRRASGMSAAFAPPPEVNITACEGASQ